MTMASDDTLAPELDRLRRLDAVAALLPSWFALSTSATFG